MIDQVYQAYLDANKIICTDSRKIVPGSLFFALRGENFDGNKYAQLAISNGASAAIIDNPDFIGKNTIQVKNSLQTLQNLATEYRIRNDFKVLALTGSNGKTTTKELIYSVLKKKYNCHATIGNYNNHIGVPLTILSAPEDSEILVVEMGANHRGEIAELSEIAQPDYGLITNMGMAHLEGFGGFDGVKKAKTELYRYLKRNHKTVFLNESDTVLKEQIGEYKNIVGYGTSESGFFVKNTSFDNGVQTYALVNGTEVLVKTQLFGYYNIINVLTAIRIGVYFEVPVNDILDAISSYAPKNNRSQILNTKTNNIILDSYNANPSSMQAALESFNSIDHLKKILILGSMKELGGDSKLEHSKLVNNAKQLNGKQIILVGPEFDDVRYKGSAYFQTTEELVKHLQKNPIQDSLILIKGSRSNRLEMLIDYL